MTAILAIERQPHTLEWLIDEIYICLSTNPRYCQQAQELLYRIPVSNPIPSFKIKLGDLGPRLEARLYETTKLGRRYILAQVLARLLEDADLYYYNSSARRFAKMLSVELEL